MLLLAPRRTANPPAATRRGVRRPHSSNSSNRSSRSSFRSSVVGRYFFAFGCCWGSLLSIHVALGEDAGDKEGCLQTTSKYALDADFFDLELMNQSGEQRPEGLGVSLLQGRAADRRFRKNEAPASALSTASNPQSITDADAKKTAPPPPPPPLHLDREEAPGNLGRKLHPAQRRLGSEVYSTVSLFGQDSNTSDPSPEAPEVTVACGNIRGMQARKNVAAYWGIPFGKAPKGDLRFKPPQAATCWRGTLDATKSRASCLPAPMPPLVVPGNFSEDCLHLDVFAPTKNGFLYDPKSLPVVVNIFGGSLVSGSSASMGPIQAFVDRSMKDGKPFVLMAMNYRLGALGFAAIEELAKADPRGVAGNYGILDQILSLEWLRDNIAAFGGDPKRVTLMGQSSGGTSIFALLAAPSARGLFHSVMSFSGSPQLSTPRDVKEDQDKRLWLPGTGCGKETGDGLLACLMKADAEALQNALTGSYEAEGFESSLPNSAKGSLGWSALVYVDGVTIPQSVKEALAGGSARHVNVMFTTMQCEADSPKTGSETLVEGALQGFSLGKGGEKDAQNLMRAYRDEAGRFTAEENRVTYASGALVADSAVTCGNVYLALAAARGGSKNVFVGTTVQGPANKVVDLTCTGQVLDSQLPFHGFDYQSVLTWANGQTVWIPDGWCPYVPDSKDIGLAENLWSSWLSFIGTGRPEASWHRIKDLGFSTKNLYAHGVLGFDGKGGITTELDWKLEQCRALHEIGVGETYWWQN